MRVAQQMSGHIFSTVGQNPPKTRELRCAPGSQTALRQVSIVYRKANDAIFPRTHEDDAEDPEHFDSGYEFINHSCAASGPEVAQQLQDYADRGWLEEVTYQGLQEKFGARPRFETYQEDAPGSLAEVV